MNDDESWNWDEYLQLVDMKHYPTSSAKYVEIVKLRRLLKELRSAKTPSSSAVLKDQSLYGSREIVSLLNLSNPRELNEIKRHSEQNGHQLGMSLNHDKSVELYEILSTRLVELYVPNQTASTLVSVDDGTSLRLTASEKKKRKSCNWNFSPRTRLSFLAKRSAIFRRRSSSGASQGGSAERPSTSGTQANVRLKRALFQSPEEDNKYKTPDTIGARRRVRQPLYRLSQNVPKTEPRRVERKKCTRSLFLNEIQEDSKEPNADETVSQLHRRKLLWATGTAIKSHPRAADLKKNNVKFAASLYNEALNKWADVSKRKEKLTGSTSDDMLSLVNGLLDRMTGQEEDLDGVAPL